MNEQIAVMAIVVVAVIKKAHKKAGLKPME